MRSTRGSVFRLQRRSASVKNNDMNHSFSPADTQHASALHAPCLRELAPEMAGRVGMIMDKLKALIAARFLKIPLLLPLLMPLWTRLNRIQRRLKRAMELHGVMRRVRASQAGRSARVRDAAEVRLPQRFGWLVWALGWEAAAYAGHLEQLLAQPEIMEVLAACPGASRVLRPVARMLAIQVAGTPLASAPRVRRVGAMVRRRGLRKRREVPFVAPVADVVAKVVVPGGFGRTGPPGRLIMPR